MLMKSNYTDDYLEALKLLEPYWRNRLSEFKDVKSLIEFVRLDEQRKCLLEEIELLEKTKSVRYVLINSLVAKQQRLLRKPQSFTFI